MKNTINHWTIRTEKSDGSCNYAVYSNMTEREAVAMAKRDNPNSVENGRWPYILDVCRP